MDSLSLSLAFRVFFELLNLPGEVLTAPVGPGLGGGGATSWFGKNKSRRVQGDPLPGGRPPPRPWRSLTQSSV